MAEEKSSNKRKIVVSEEDALPDDLVHDSPVFDITFHPKERLIATGQIDGSAHIYSYDASCNQLLHDLRHHKKSCRSVAFSTDGKYLYTASKDKSVYAVEVETGKIHRKLLKAHESPIYCIKAVGENLIASGDDDGVVKLWDTRNSGKNIMNLQENNDYISDLDADVSRKTLLATSGDGVLSVFNLRQRKLIDKSDNQESELLCLSIIKHGRKVVCGTGDGIINIYSWDQWGDMSDRFPGHPMSIDTCVRISENVICTGSMDGIIRAVNIQPNRLLGIVGEHANAPIEKLSVSSTNNHLVASCAHDAIVKFWNIADFLIPLDRDSKKFKKNAMVKKRSKNSVNNNFFANL